MDDQITYGLNCALCGGVYTSKEAFPESQICPVCALPPQGRRLTYDPMGNLPQRVFPDEKTSEIARAKENRKTRDRKRKNRKSAKKSRRKNR